MPSGACVPFHQSSTRPDPRIGISPPQGRSTKGQFRNRQAGRASAPIRPRRRALPVRDLPDRDPLTTWKRSCHRCYPGSHGHLRLWTLALKGAGDVGNPSIRACSVSSCRTLPCRQSAETADQIHRAKGSSHARPLPKPAGGRSGLEGKENASWGQNVSTDVPAAPGVASNGPDRSRDADRRRCCRVRIVQVDQTALTPPFKCGKRTPPVG